MNIQLDIPSLGNEIFDLQVYYVKKTFLQNQGETESSCRRQKIKNMYTYKYGECDPQILRKSKCY